MISRSWNVFDDRSDYLRDKIISIYSLLIAANAAAWAWALVAFDGYPLLLGTAMLAYSFGLRHGLDCDHIAAIDNVTRKLMQEKKRPVGVGLFFSLGHSTIVIALTILVALTTTALQDNFDSFKTVGGVIGTSVSALFLLAIAVANVLVLISICNAFQSVKRGGPFVEDDIDLLLGNRGFLGRLFRRLFRVVEASWHMYPLGLLFGLGFDTATEIGLLGFSASQASEGLSIWSILVFPALFTAGMTLVDTTDNVLMLGAYGWAFVKPIRKLYYNLTITAVSVVVAALIGGLETLDLIGDKLGFAGADRFWGTVRELNYNLGTLGYLMVAIFGLAWLISYVVYRLNGYDEIEIKVGKDASRLELNTSDQRIVGLFKQRSPVVDVGTEPRLRTNHTMTEFAH